MNLKSAHARDVLFLGSMQRMTDRQRQVMAELTKAFAQAEAGMCEVMPELLEVCRQRRLNPSPGRPIDDAEFDRDRDIQEQGISLNTWRSENR